MAKVFFTSDLHFGHKNLCENLRNMTYEESDELIIRNWNKVVSKKDIVYILGDIVMENPSNLVTLKQLKGIIRVIGGNHDDRKVCKTLNDMGIIVMGCLHYKGFICTHIPVHPSELGKDKFIGNIHGHIHLGETFKTDENNNQINWEYKPENIKDYRYINVNTEYNNYTPVPFEYINNRINILNKINHLS